MKKGSLRPENMTVKEYAAFLGGISTRTIENWEYRGTSETTKTLLMKIWELQSDLEWAYEKLNENGMIFKL